MAKKVKANRKTGNPRTSEFNGGLFSLIGNWFLRFFLVVFTLTLGTAWAKCMKIRWYAKHTRINGKQLMFDGKGIQLFGTYIKWFILTILTVGIFAFWLPIKMEKWKMKHLFVREYDPMQYPMQNGGYFFMPPMQASEMPQMPFGYPTMPY